LLLDLTFIVVIIHIINILAYLFNQIHLGVSLVVIVTVYVVGMRSFMVEW